MIVQNRNSTSIIWFFWTSGIGNRGGYGLCFSKFEKASRSHSCSLDISFLPLSTNDSDVSLVLFSPFNSAISTKRASLSRKFSALRSSSGRASGLCFVKIVVRTNCKVNKCHDYGGFIRARLQTHTRKSSTGFVSSDTTKVTIPVNQKRAAAKYM